MPLEPPADPLPSLVWSRYHDFRLRNLGSSSLSLVSRFGPLLHFSLVAWFFLMAAVAAGMALGEFNRSLKSVLWVACAICLLISVCLLFLPLFIGPFLEQTRFDRRANRLNLAPWGTHPRQKLPLDRVQAVQFLAIGSREDEDGPYPSYQLNLILSGDPPDRAHLIENGRPEILRAMAQQLASFLQVPLFEQTAPVPVDAQPAEPAA
jgi:hypothetical protein